MKNFNKIVFSAQLLLAILVGTYSPLRAQFIQKGSDIDGEATGDESGYSVSMGNANTVAIGAWLNNGNSTWSGHTRIYDWNGSSWMQKGTDINGEALGDQAGFAVSMPDSVTVAIGSPKNNGSGNDAGHVRIFEWNGTTWQQKGGDIDGEAANDWSGYAVSMSDANTVAIGALNNVASGSPDIGHVRIYAWNGTSWNQKGNDLDGEAAYDESGESVAMPDANTVAIGAHKNDGNGTDAGHVRIYEWSGTTWIQKGTDIDGEAANDNSGTAVCMPNANTVAIGALNNDGSGSNAGHVRVYRWNGSNWIQKGLDINGEAANDQSGYSIDMPDTNTLAIGAVNNDGNGTNAGQVRIYSWNGSNWIQSNTDINGEAANDKSGWSVSMGDSHTVAIGAVWNDGNGTSSGHTRVYAFTCNSIASISPVACDSFTVPSANATYYASATVMDTIPNAAGCDSIITINLTINHSDNTIDTITACDSYAWIDGNTYTASNNSATHTLTNAAGCDSVVSLDLTVNYSTTSTDTATACDSYTWIDGNTYFSSNNTATHILTNAAGCDSVVTLDLTVNYSTTSTDTVTACDSYTWIDGNTYNSSNNTATHILTNAVGCDSVVSLDLTINNSTTSTDTVTACDSYTWIDGNTYTSSNNTATHTLTNTVGCDSVVSLELDINTVDPTVVVDQYTLTAVAQSATYQWVDCEKDYAAISQATNQSFTPSANGVYAVIITKNGCTDTSSCITISTIGLEATKYRNAIIISPNPTEGLLNIDLGRRFHDIQLTLTSVTGRVIMTTGYTDQSMVSIAIEGPPGSYLLSITADGEWTEVVKVFKSK